MIRLFDAYRKALYGWIRQRMRPLSIEEAEEKKLFWARMYALVSFTLLGAFTYKAYKGTFSVPIRDDLPKNVATALQLTDSQNIRFISYKGFKKVEDFRCTKEELEEMANTPKSKPVPDSNNSTTES